MTTLYGTHNYQYDLEGQLVSASHPEGDTLHTLESFAYDSLGNRTADNQGAFVYDTNKFQLIEDWKYIYAYDLNGNLVTKQEKGLTGKVQNFIYTSENQLAQIDFIENGATVKQVNYSYDALGRRVKKRILEGNQETIRKYVYDSNEIIAELNEANEVLVRYTHSGLRTDDVLGMNVTQAGVNEGFAPTSGNYFFLKDGLGSITEITNSTGQVVQRYAYSSFGKIFKIENGGVDNTESPDIKSPFTYTNREYDSESGLYYYRARYFDPALGRFLAEDPDPGRLLSPLSFTSKYIYALNSPIRYTDPTGESIWNIITKSFNTTVQLATIPILAAVSSFNAARSSGGNFWQSLGVAVSSYIFTSAAIAITTVANAYLSPWFADIVTPFTTGLISMAHNATNQFIMNGKVNGNRAWKAGVRAAAYQAAANLGSAYWNGTPVGIYADTTSAAVIVACTDDGTSFRTKEDVDKEGIIDFSCNFTYGF